MKSLKNEQKQFVDNMSNNIPSVDLSKEIVFTDFVNRKRHFKQMSSIPTKAAPGFSQTWISPFNAKGPKVILDNKSLRPATMVAKTSKSDKDSPERDEHHKLASHHEHLTAQGDQTDRTRYAFRDKQFKASAATQKRDVPRLYSISPPNPATRSL